MQTLTLLVRSSGGVPDERRAVGRAVERLQARYWHFIRLEAVAQGPATFDEEEIRRAMPTTTPAGDFAGRFEEALEKLIVREIGRQRGLAGGAVKPKLLEGPPFLAAGIFDYDDAPRLFGRNRSIAGALGMLKQNRAAGPAFLLIHGPAGSGKSSLMRAGLAPNLTVDSGVPEAGAWCGTTVLAATDNAAPLETLARAVIEALPEMKKLRDTSRTAEPGKTTKGRKSKKAKKAPKSAACWDAPRLADALGSTGDLVFAIAAIVAALDRISAAKPAHFLLLVDQLESVFTAREVTPAARDGYFRVLAALATSDRVWVIATMRDAFVPCLAEHPDLFALVRGGGTFALGPPEPAELLQIIRGPMLAAGLEFEHHPESGRELSEQLLRDAATLRDPLPLLEPVLEKLYEGRRGQVLTWSAYEESGGLAAAVMSPDAPGSGRRFPLLSAASLLIAGVSIAWAVMSREGQRQALATTQPGVEASTQSTVEMRHELAVADFAAAGGRLDAGAPDEALPYLIGALENDPRHLDAQALLFATLRTTRWHVPVAVLDHPLGIGQLSFGGDGETLYASVGGGFATTLRWDLPSAAITAVLKPVNDAETRRLAVAPGGKRVIVERGDLVLLCDGETLDPIRVLPLAAGGPLAWSPEGALLAYAAEDGDGFRWVIADAARGITIRQSDVFAAGAPLAVQLDRVRLRGVHDDGTLVELPLAVNHAVGISSGAVKLSRAVLSPDGSEMLARLVPGGSGVKLFSLSEEEGLLGLLEADGPGPGSWLEAGADEALERSKLLESPRAGVRLPLGSGDVIVPALIDGSVVELAAAPPMRLEAEVKALAFRDARVAAGTASGRVTVEEFLPALGYGSVVPSAAPENKISWRIERQDAGFRLIPVAGDPVPLGMPGAWTTMTAAAISPDGSRVVIAGAGSLPGIVIAAAADGRVLCEIEPVDGAAQVAFLADGRVAVAGERELWIFSTEGDRLEKVGAIPATAVRDLFVMPAAGWLAVAKGKGVSLFDPRNFAHVAELPAADGASMAVAGSWAEDAGSGWLARATEHDLTVWSTRSRRVLLHLRLSGRVEISFSDVDGMRGLRMGETFLPLARLAGIESSALEDLRAFCRGLGGVERAEKDATLVYLTREERHGAMKRDFTDLAGLFPGADPLALRDAMQALPFAASAADAWRPLWERLAMIPDVDEARLIRWSAGAGDQAWFQQYLRGRIARSDVDLNFAWEGEAGAGGSVGWMHDLAGDPAGTRALKQASWLAADKQADGGDDALDLLDARVEASGAAYEAEPVADRALAHAEALAWRGETAKAADFLAGKVPADAVLTLEQAHFLLSFGLADAVREVLDAAVDRIGSPWLRRQWLQAGAGGESVAAMVESTMNAVEGRGPAAVEALWISLVERDGPAIATCLKAAKDLPEPLMLYAVGAALWAEGKKAEAFALWPAGFPDLDAEAASGDWKGWELALPGNGEESLFATMQDSLATLAAGPGAGIDELIALATLLLDPETTATFGIKRVRDAMLDCALSLAGDKGSAGVVGKLVDRARLAGAPNLACLRIEARSFMAAGEFSLAYSRWLQVIDAEEEGILQTDYVEAARCVLEDLQDAAAIELLMRGKERFAGDSGYASDAAWLLLNTSHPEEAGILLDHGFGIPFTADQRQNALAMLVCAAEQTQRTERADQAFRELVALDPEWSDEQALRNRGWPDILMQPLQAVAARNP